MAKVLTADNANTLLAVGASSGATSIVVSAGTGALFPSPNPATGTYFFGTLVSQSNPNVRAIVICTARTTDTVTVQPLAAAWLAGDTFALLQPAELMQVMVQFDDLQAQLGNYAIDTGAANAYVVTLSPAVATPEPNIVYRWLAGHANTGTSTFNGQPLVRPNGAALQANDILASTLYECQLNPSSGAYQLNSVMVSAFSQLTGQVSNGQVPEAAVLQYLGAILTSPVLTGTPTAPTASAGTNNTQLATTAFANAAAVASAAGLIAYSLNNPGYFQIGPFKLQWGTFSTNGSANQTVTFGQNFSIECYGVTFTPPVSGFTAGLVSQATNGFDADTTRLGAGLTVTYWAWGK